MTRTIVHLPVVQHWDCQANGTCCQEYAVPVSPEEQERLRRQGWDPVRDLGGYTPFRRRGWLRRRYFLNHRPDGRCIFFTPEGRCRIHERHGYDAKPLACRLYPFVLVPVADQWRVSLHFACPSAAANRGRLLHEHDPLLRELAGRLAEREGQTLPAGELLAPPPLVRRQRLAWPELLGLVEELLGMLRDRAVPLERRWRKCLVIADLLRQTELDRLSPVARAETLAIVRSAADDVPRDPCAVPAPSALGRLIFRLIAALCTRKDRGPNRGLASRNWLGVFRGVFRFARGAGTVPRFNRLIPETTFAQAEQPGGPLSPAAEVVLERYYALKLGALQFCGRAAFGLCFWDGLEVLAMTLPLVLWITRLCRDLSQEQAVIRALIILDDHFSSSLLLARGRLRLAFRTVARRGDLARLIAWYSR